MADKKEKKEFAEQLPGYDPLTHSTWIKEEPETKPADLTSAIWPPKAKAIIGPVPPELSTKFDEPIKMAKGYAEGGFPGADDEMNQGIQNYFDQTKQAIGNYSPANQAQSAQGLISAQNGVGSNIAKGAAGLSDAIMQGVARAGNPGFLQNIENNQTKNLENVENMGKSLNEQNIQGVKENMALDQMNPGSPIGQMKTNGAAAAMKTVFPKMSDDEINKLVMSPSFGELFPQLATVRGKEIENKWKGAELGLGERRLDSEDADRKLARELEEKRISAETANQQMQRQQKGEELKANAVKELSGLPWYSRLLHPGISGTLEKQAGLAPTEETGPYGAETVRDGKTYEWSNLSKKYHLKQ